VKDSDITVPKNTLRRFNRLDDLSNYMLEQVSAGSEFIQAKKRSRLVELGSEDNSSIYLVKGKVRLLAQDGKNQVISDSDEAAKNPISRLRPSRYEVTALTPVSYLKIDNELLDSVLHLDEPTTMLSNHYEVSEFTQEDADSTSQLVMQIYQDLNRKQAYVPSWQPIAVRISQAILTGGVDPNRISQIMRIDPVLTAKIVRASKDASVSGISARTCRDCISRLGLTKINHLAFMNLFQESLRTDDDDVNWFFKNWWERSITVGAVCRLLATQSEQFNPDIMELAGLLHAIGEPIILGYVSRSRGPLAKDEINKMLRSAAKGVGQVLLTQWDMPREFVNVVVESCNWKLGGSSQADTVDVVLLARAYTALGRKEDVKLPGLKLLPAYKKLGLEKADYEFEKQIKDMVHQTVSETIIFLKTISSNIAVTDS